MELNELIEQEGVEKVAIKTAISHDNLNFLVGEKFEKLSRVKALGFLEILQREYKELEVSELKERVKLYFEENKPDYTGVVVVTKASSSEGGFSFFKWSVILGILFGGWYLYSQGKLNGLLQNVVSKEDVYGDEKALENNISTKEAERVAITKNVEEPVIIVAPVKEKIDLEAEVEVAKEENITAEVSSEAVTVEEAVAKEIAKAEEVQSVATQAEESITVPEEEEVVTATEISTITINPTRGMLWFGFINVDTKKKKEFMTQISTPFDIKGGRWILVTGHGFVDVVSELNTLEESDSHKHYFYVDSSELKEITQQEFRDFNGGRGWI